MLKKSKTQHNDDLKELYLKKIEFLETREKLREMLPHLYSQKHYLWSREFFEWTQHKYQILTAANQVGKSTIAIKKIVHIATHPELWKKYWPEMPEGEKPVFWYLYPNKETASIEFDEKWRALMPNVTEDDPQYGWKMKGQLSGRSSGGCYLQFNSGAKLHFKYYSQDVHHLQAGTAWIIVCDEETPVDLLPELQARINATDGYMIFVFTATRGQQFWREVVETRTKWQTEAKVWQVSLYDCQTYEDGTKSRWTDERIRQAIRRCATQAEVQRRIFGRFVVDEGLMFPMWDRSKHLKEWHLVPSEWSVYVGVDYGSASSDGAHPSAISFIAVNPERTQGRVILHWRGDKQVTTAQDVVTKYSMMARHLKNIVGVWYDYASADIGIIANRSGIPFQKADKGRTRGVALLGTLLKNDCLHVYTPCEASHKAGIPDDWIQGEKIAWEFESLKVDGDKRQAQDDSIDSVRYASMPIPWAWEILTDLEENREVTMAEHIKTVDELRREAHPDKQKAEDIFDVGEELEFWNDYLS